MTTHWTVEIPNSGLKTYIWCRSDGFPKPVISKLREVYKEAADICDKSIWNPVEALFALLFIRNETAVEGFTEEIEFRHVIVNIQRKEIMLVGNWMDPKGLKNHHGTYSLEESK